MASSYPAPSFEAALTRAFGPRAEFRSVLLHALRRGAGGRVALLLMPDGALWLAGRQNDAGTSGAVLLDIAAPRAPADETLLALCADVIDWRGAERRYNALLARRGHWSVP